MSSTAACRGLMQRLGDGEAVVVAEGYLFNFERRGYLQAGGFVPEVVLERPDLVKLQHEEFVHAGSDVVLAFTYYGHREKMRLIGREADLEPLNRNALQIAREVADNTGTLMAGNICNSTLYQRDNPEKHDEIRAVFKEQIEWAVEGKADYIVAETFGEVGEATIALECIKKYGNGVPAVITLAAHHSDVTLDGVPWAEACRVLEREGADVVGFNCHRGPDTMLPLLQQARTACKGPLAALPVPYRTYEDGLSFMKLKDPQTGAPSFPTDLDRWLCNRTQIENFTREADKLGVKYLGLCCGTNAGHLRAMAEALGRQVPASRFSPNMKNHFIFGNREEFKGRSYQSKEFRQLTAGIEDTVCK